MPSATAANLLKTGLQWTFEDYLSLFVHLASKARALEAEGEVAIDHLLVKWYVKTQLGAGGDLQVAKQLHAKCAAAVDLMIYHKLLQVVSQECYGSKTWRMVEVPADVCTEALYFALQGDADIKPLQPFEL